MPYIWIANTAIKARANVVFKSAFADRKNGTNTSCPWSISVTPIEPIPGNTPIQLFSRINRKRVATSGKYFNVCFRSPNIWVIKSKMPSIINSTVLCSLFGIIFRLFTTKKPPPTSKTVVNKESTRLFVMGNPKMYPNISACKLICISSSRSIILHPAENVNPKKTKKQPISELVLFSNIQGGAYGYRPLDESEVRAFRRNDDPVPDEFERIFSGFPFRFGFFFSP